MADEPVLTPEQMRFLKLSERDLPPPPTPEQVEEARRRTVIEDESPQMFREETQPQEGGRREGPDTDQVGESQHDLLMEIRDGINSLPGEIARALGAGE